MKRISLALLVVTFVGSSIFANDDGPNIGALLAPAKDVAAVFGTRGSLRTGATVIDILEGSPAEAAGIQIGDVVARINGTSISDTNGYQRAIGKCEVGKPATMHIRRAVKNKVETISVIVTPKSQSEMEELIKKTCPIRVFVLGIKEDEIGTPVVYTLIKNRSTSPVVAAEIKLECFNSFGDRVTFAGRPYYNGITQDEIPSLGLKPAEWRLSLQDTTTRVTGTIQRVKTKDSEWKGSAPILVLP